MTYSWRVQFSALVGDKLFEAGEVAVRSKIKTQNVIEELELKVEFPDLRKLVNLDKIRFCTSFGDKKKGKEVSRVAAIRIRTRTRGYLGLPS